MFAGIPVHGAGSSYCPLQFVHLTLGPGMLASPISVWFCVQQKAMIANVTLLSLVVVSCPVFWLCFCILSFLFVTSSCSVLVLCGSLGCCGDVFTR